jgi:hypothetical protein
MRFIIEVEMKDRWVPHFLGMLRYMQVLGSIGGSRMVSFLSDGDGDFRPKFNWDSELPVSVEGIRDDNGNRTFDAG